MLPIVGDVGDQALVAELIEDHGVECDHPFRRLDHRAGFDEGSARLLRQQHRQLPRPDRGRGQGRRPPFHLLLDRRGLRQSGARAGRRGRSDRAAVALRLVEADDRDDAARRQRRARARATWRSATSMSPAPIRRCAPGCRRPAPRISSRSRSKPRSAAAPRIDVFGTDYPTPGRHLHPRFHPCQRSRARASRGAGAICARGGASATLNCGYGRGYSVREVLDAVRRAVGHGFPVNFGERRPGDIVVSVAAANRIREVLDWTPELDDLDAIVAPRAGLGTPSHGRPAPSRRGPRGDFGLIFRPVRSR